MQRRSLQAIIDLLSLTMSISDLPFRQICQKATQLAVLPVVVAGGFVAGIPLSVQAAYYNPPPYRSSVRDYNACAGELLSTGLSPEAASAACGGALYPRALSACVTSIDGGTEIAAADALAGCRRVRRPQELASCVVGINGIKTTGTEPLEVLDYCRRSLLPARFSNCVVGLAGQIPAYTTTEVMTSCIAASNRPRQVLPSFIPQGQEIPLQPLPGGENAGQTTTPTLPTEPFNPALSEPAPTTPPSRSVPALW